VLRAISSLLVVDDVHRHRLPPRASSSPRKPHARDPLYSCHGLLGVSSSTQPLYRLQEGADVPVAESEGLEPSRIVVVARHVIRHEHVWILDLFIDQHRSE